MHASRLRRVLTGCLFLSSVSARSGAEPPASPRAPDLPDAPARASPSTEAGPRRLVTSAFAGAAVRAALSAAHAGEAWARISSLAARAHSSAILPEVVVRVARNTDESLHLSPTADDPYNYTAVGGAGWWLEGRLIWHLDRLVFNTHDLGIERLRVEHADRTGRIAAKVLETLFAWQRAALRAADGSAPDDERASAELDEAEAEIMLDELTGGWFGRELARRRANE